MSNARGMPGGGMLKLRLDRYINRSNSFLGADFLEYTYFSRLVKVIIRILQPFFMFFLSLGVIF